MTGCYQATLGNQYPDYHDLWSLTTAEIVTDILRVIWHTIFYPIDDKANKRQINV